MMIFKILTILSLLALSLNADMKQIEVRATGMTKQEAITNALVEAISRVHGLSVASDTKSSFSHDQFSSSKNGENNEGSFAENSLKKDISTITKGAVKTYDVLSAEKKDNEWTVELLVSIPVYKEIGVSSKNRRKIAVMPFSTLDKHYKLKNKTYRAFEVTEIITQALVTNLTQSRKFAVLDRSYTRDMAKEMNLLDSNQVELSQKVRLGQKLGADYILVGTLKNASTYENNSVNKSLGTSLSSNRVELIIDYRIIVVGTSQIKWSDTVKVVLDTQSQNLSYRMLMQESIEKAANIITNDLLENIFPIKIVSISNSGTIILNQGGNTLSKGVKLDVMKLGEKMYDPYTKESLGRLEDKVAVVELTRVTPKLSYAKVVDGILDLISKNDICRRQNNNSSTQAKQSYDNKNWRGAGDVVVEDGGGVHLPFD